MIQILWLTTTIETFIHEKIINLYCSNERIFHIIYIILLLKIQKNFLTVFLKIRLHHNNKIRFFMPIADKNN